MTDLGDWAALGGAFAAGVGALGTWAAARTALRAVRISAQTARQNTESVARDQRPTIYVFFPNATQTLPDPAEMVIDVQNAGKAFLARSVVIELTRLDGAAQPPVVLGPIDVLGPEETERITTPPIPAPYGDGGVGDGKTREVLHVEAFYEDTSQTLGWRQPMGALSAISSKIIIGGSGFKVSHQWRPTVPPPIEYILEGASTSYGANLWRALRALGRAIINRPVG